MLDLEDDGGSQEQSLLKEHASISKSTWQVFQIVFVLLMRHIQIAYDI